MLFTVALALYPVFLGSCKPIFMPRVKYTRGIFINTIIDYEAFDTYYVVFYLLGRFRAEP